MRNISYHLLALLICLACSASVWASIMVPAMLGEMSGEELLSTLEEPKSTFSQASSCEDSRPELTPMPERQKLATYLGIAAGDNQVLQLEIWNVDQEQLVWLWECKRRPTTARRRLKRVTWNADGNRFAAFGYGDLGENGYTYHRDHVHVFDIEKKERFVKLLPNGMPEILSAAWSMNGRLLAIGTADGRLEVVDAENGASVFSQKIHLDGITSLAWHPAGNRLAAGSVDGDVKIASSNNGSVLLNFAPFPSRVSSLAWSDDGQRLAAATTQGEIQTWDAGRAYELTSGNARRGELAWAYQNQSRLATEENSADALRAFLHYAPDTLGFWQARGDTYAELGEFQRASEEFSKAVGPELQYSFWAACSRACALLGANRLDEYHRACAELVEAFRDSPIPSNRGWVMWAASLTPNPNIDTAAVAEMAAWAEEEQGVRSLLHWGAALYRNGQFEEATRLLTEVAEAPRSHGDLLTDYHVGCATYFLSMLRSSLGHTLQSQRLFEKANDGASVYFDRDPGRSWRRLVALQTLRQEATAMIDGNSPR